MLETHETSRATRPVASFGTGSAYATTRRRAGAPNLRRDAAEDFAAPMYQPDDDLERGLADEARQRRKATRGGRAKQPGKGRTAVVLTLVILLGISAAGLWKAKAALLSDRRFAIASSESIQIAGNTHLSRAQLLSVFGDDVDRNLLTVSLSERRAELEQLPWVEHATVMRLLPNHIRVSIVERVPVAFYRQDDPDGQGSKIGLVDANGVLLDLPDADSNSETGSPAPHYSFPVLTGIGADVPLSTRSARMKIFQAFTSALDGADHNAPKGDRISDKLSEVDLSSPEDVRALIPTSIGDILVHFGDDDFLDRYLRFQQNLPKWQADYPKLASADMRYPSQVVLEMPPGSQQASAKPAPVAAAAPSPLPAPKQPAAPKPAAAAPKPVAAAPKPVAATPAKTPVKAKQNPKQKPARKPAPAKAPAKHAPQFAPPHMQQQHLQNAYDVPAGSHHRATKAVPQ